LNQLAFGNNLKILLNVYINLTLLSLLLSDILWRVPDVCAGIRPALLISDGKGRVKIAEGWLKIVQKH